MDAPLSGPAPFGAYAFLYENTPDVLKKGDAFRAALAPVYLDSEYGRPLSEGIILGIGLAGGGYAFGYSEMRNGRYLKGESYQGHGASPSLSLYVRLNPGQKIPLDAVFRLAVREVLYKKARYTRSDFVLPPDHADFTGRVGFRLGGQEPVLDPLQAGEVSLWYEEHRRTANGDYGLGNDRTLQKASQVFWMRSLVAHPIGGERVSLMLAGGNIWSPDRTDAFRLGGSLPLAAEFPLDIPGYANQELTARTFGLLNARVARPLGSGYDAAVRGAVALADYIPDTGQRGSFNSGAGAGIGYETPKKVWRGELDYGYGFTAQRGGRRGAHSVGLFFQYDFEAGLPRPRREAQPLPRQNLDWLLHR